MAPVDGSFWVFSCSCREGAHHHRHTIYRPHPQTASYTKGGMLSCGPQYPPQLLCLQCPTKLSVSKSVTEREDKVSPVQSSGP